MIRSSDAIRAAASFGLTRLPDDFLRMSSAEKSSLASAILDEIQKHAANDDKTAQAFLATHFQRRGERNNSGREWQGRSDRFITTAELANASHEFARRVPHISAVAAVPRSGMLPASIIAMDLQIPLYSVTSVAQNVSYIGGGDLHLIPVGHGYRLAGHSPSNGPVLVIDDTACSGKTLRRVKDRLDSGGRSIVYGVIYCAPKAVGISDLYHEVLPEPHILEWNFANSAIASHLATDMDGIICEDFPEDALLDERKYIMRLQSAPPRHLYRRGVAAIITARLEKYRRETERWLTRHGVRYDAMTMGPWRDERRDNECVGSWKARVIEKMPISLYVESCPEIARIIGEKSGKPCACPEAGRIFWPGR